jgi:hypothetical protein
MTGYNHEFDRRPPVANAAASFIRSIEPGIQRGTDDPDVFAVFKYPDRVVAIRGEDRLKTRVFDQIARDQEKKRLVLHTRTNLLTGRACALSMMVFLNKCIVGALAGLFPRVSQAEPGKRECKAAQKCHWIECRSSVPRIHEP